MKNPPACLLFGLLLSINIHPAARAQSPSDVGAQIAFDKYVTSFPPSDNESFAAATHGWKIDRDFVFGAKSNARVEQIAIRNTTELSNYWNAYADRAGTNTINAELARYEPFSSAANFIFESYSLDLTGTIDAGHNIAPLIAAQAASHGGIHLNGTPTSIKQFLVYRAGDLSSLTTTVGLSIGEIVRIVYSGTYYISAIVPNTSITLSPLFGSVTEDQFNQLVAFMRWSTASTSVASNGKVLTFSQGVPSLVSPGQAIMLIYGDSGSVDFPRFVVSQTDTTVTLDKPINIALGQAVLFHSPIRTAQIWSKDRWSAGHDEVRAVAVEWTVQLPGSPSGPQGLKGNSSLSQWLSAPANAPFGAWPALWTYSGFDNYSLPAGNDEIDTLEMLLSATQDFSIYTGNDHVNVGTKFINRRTDGAPLAPFGGSWSFFKPHQYYSAAQNFSTMGFIKAAHIQTPTEIYRYLNGQLVSVTQAAWTSPQRMQIAADMAIGSLAKGIGANFSQPFANSNFAGMRLKVAEVRVLTLTDKPVNPLRAAATPSALASTK